MSHYFITGTDTEVGKTHVTQTLLRHFQFQGKTTLGLKPIASGAENTVDGLKNSDALSLIAASTEERPYQDVNPFVFAPAIAPHIAAAQADSLISVDSLQTWYQSLSLSAELVFLEGAGGWKCPLNNKETYADFVIAESLPVILVVGMRLGCLNHAMLTAESILTSGVPFYGWIANILDPSMPVLEENLATLEHFMPVPRLAVQPYSAVIPQKFEPGHRLDLLVH